ncbi:MAG TPA: alpha/beta hydrolase [Candidatus Binatia bacterium]|jgi:pimeloyl-ACP methyl ester carboxylesterase
MKLVLLPGMDGTGILFEPLVKALPENLQPMVHSYPGDKPMSYEELLPAIAASLPAEEPFIVLGESFSGPLALRIAAACPAGLRGVILCASFARNPIRFFPRACIPLIHPIFFSRTFLPIVGVHAMIAGYAAGPVSELVRRVHALVTPQVLAARARAIVAVDAEDALAACSYPILYLAGSRDRVVPRYSRIRIQRIRPDVRVVVLDAPHLLLQSAPEPAAQAISEFAASLELKQKSGRPTGNGREFEMEV